ncbi:MAG TPA: ParB/RepB/Spo0J family partition protein [Caulobacteraceae bacterium]
MAQEGRRGLGRGLSALLGENEVSVTLGADPQPAVGARPGWAHMMPIELLHPNPDQPRKVFSDTELDELAASIREKGVIQPLLVRPGADWGEYEIVAGERRWRAAQRAGARELPVVIRTLADGEVLEIGIIENVQRVDLNPIEEALAYKQLMERFGRTQDAVAEVVGKSRPHVANALRLLNLPEAVQGYVLQGQLTAGHARAVLASADPVGLARQVIDQNLSVRQAEALAKKAGTTSGGQGPRPKAPGHTGGGKDADTLALEGDLSEALGLDVEIFDKDGVGEVRIRYATLEQLDEVCRRLSRH